MKSLEYYVNSFYYYPADSILSLINLLFSLYQTATLTTKN